MGVIETTRGVLWARKHAPDQPAYGDPVGALRVYGKDVLPELRR